MSFLSKLFGKSYSMELQKINDIIIQLSKGDYSLNINVNDYSTKAKKIAESLLELKKSLTKNTFEAQVVSSQITSVSQQLSITLDESKEFTKELGSRADEMMNLNENSIDKVKTAMYEINNIVDMFESVKGTSEKIASTSIHSKDIINNSLEGIMEIVEAVKEIKGSTDLTVNNARELETASKEISYILKTVGDIANKTNLLALNASIESARAGEHGKGFGVVAEQIRALAESSKQSVLQITGLVKKISSQVENLTKALEPNLNSVQKSVECSKNIENSLNSIRKCYDGQMTDIQEIMEISQEEYSLISNITSKVRDMENTFKKVNSSVSSVYNSVKKQGQSIEDIEQMGNSLFHASESLAVFTEKAESNLLKANINKFNETANETIVKIKDELLDNKDLLPLNTNTCKEKLDYFMNKYSSVEAIWLNIPNGKFIYSNPPAGIINAKVRDWFKESIQGKEYISPVYISAITSNPCVTVSLPVKDLDGTCIGVIGVDLKLTISH